MEAHRIMIWKTDKEALTTDEAGKLKSYQTAGGPGERQIPIAPYPEIIIPFNHHSFQVKSLM